MSDKLVVEFCDGSSPFDPVLAVMAFYGGDNPETAAETLADFFLQVVDLPDIDWRDAGALGARFIALQQNIHYGYGELGTLGAVPIRRQSSYAHQLVRVFGERGGPLVEFVPDAYTRPEQLAVAKYVLARSGFETIESNAATARTSPKFVT